MFHCLFLWVPRNLKMSETDFLQNTESCISLLVMQGIENFVPQPRGHPAVSRYF